MNPPVADHDKWDSLSPRMREVMELVLDHHENKVIAAKLDISERRVDYILADAKRILASTNKYGSAREYERLRSLFGFSECVDSELFPAFDQINSPVQEPGVQVFEREDWSARVLEALDGRSPMLGRMYFMLALLLVLLVGILTFTTSMTQIGDLMCEASIRTCANGEIEDDQYTAPLGNGR